MNDFTNVTILVTFEQIEKWPMQKLWKNVLYCVMLMHFMCLA